MSNFPTPTPPAVPARTSAAAITSLIFGIPVISPLIAIICGFVGLSATKNPRVKGRGLAIAGLILGLIGAVLTIGEVGLVYAGYKTGTGIFAKLNQAVQEGKQGAATTTGLMTDLASGDVAAAQARCTANVTTDDLTKIKDELAQMGAFRDTTINKTSFSQTGSGLEGDFGGTVNFEKGVKQFDVRVVTDGGTVKVDSVTVTDSQ